MGAGRLVDNDDAGEHVIHRTSSMPRIPGDDNPWGGYRGTVNPDTDRRLQSIGRANTPSSCPSLTLNAFRTESGIGLVKPDEPNQVFLVDGCGVVVGDASRHVSVRVVLDGCMPRVEAFRP